MFGTEIQGYLTMINSTLSISVIPVASSRVLSETSLKVCIASAFFSWMKCHGVLCWKKATRIRGLDGVTVWSSAFLLSFLSGEKTQQSVHLSLPPPPLVSACVKARGWCQVSSSIPLHLKYPGRDSHGNPELSSLLLPFLNCKMDHTSLYAVQFSTRRKIL